MANIATYDYYQLSASIVVAGLCGSRCGCLLCLCRGGLFWGLRGSWNRLRRFNLFSCCRARSRSFSFGSRFSGLLYLSFEAITLSYAQI